MKLKKGKDKGKAIKVKKMNMSNGSLSFEVDIYDSVYDKGKNERPDSFSTFTLKELANLIG